MKKRILLIATAILVIITISSCHDSSVKVEPLPEADTTTHTMLHADTNTIYLDATGKKIDSKQFMESIKSGGYTFVPEMKDGKVIRVKLKASEQKVTMGSVAPGFSGTDLNGHAIDLKTLKGKTVILNFWFTSCAPCIAEIPELNELVAKHKDDKSVVFVAVTYNSAEQVKAFLKRKDFQFNILADRLDIINHYGITGFPTSIVIDKSGNIAFTLTTYDGTNVAQLNGVIDALKKT